MEAEKNISDREYCEGLIIPIREYLPSPLAFFANKIAKMRGIEPQSQPKWNNVKQIICTDRKLAEVLAHLGSGVKEVVEPTVGIEYHTLPIGIVKLD